MGLILLNLQSNQEIYLDKDNPFVIGRGSVTGCADKRVSRSHGRITCTTDGKINLLALHSNPCFFTRKGTPPVIQLNKNEEQVLSEGDCIGLLPNSYWYQITKKSKVKEKKSNESGLKSSQLIVPKIEVIPKVEVIDVEENNEMFPTLQHSASRDNKNNTPGKNVSPEIAIPSCSGVNSNFNSDSTLNIPPKLRNTCKLPVSMYEIKGQKDLQKSPTKKSTNSANTSLDFTRFKQFPGTASTLCGSNAGLALNLGTTDKTKNNSPDGGRGHQDNSQDGEDATKVKPGRPYCRYGAECYRKNAQHKLEYSHPGDDDYVPYENRPMCEYGANCYRRNLTHRRQFRHVSTEDPQTSQAPDAPAASTAAGASTPGASSNSSSKKSGERPKARLKRKRRSDKDRSPTSCHLSVTVSASPKQKRRRSSQAASSTHSSFYSSDFSFDDPLSSPDPFSDDYSSDEYLPSDESEDGFDEFYGKDSFDDYY